MPFREQSDGGSDEVELRATPYRASVRFTASRSKDNRKPLTPVTGLHKYTKSSAMRNLRRKHDKTTTHQKCLRALSNIEKNVRKLIKERDEERHKHRQVLEQLEAASSELQLALTSRDSALTESQRVGREVRELQQTLEATNAALQDLV